MTQKIWFTSDNHFGHKNILKFQEKEGTRQGADAEEMNELMIAKWNSQVALTDRVYCLGDFSFMNAERTEKVLRRLNGQLHLIRGNHDHWINHETSKYFEAIHDYKEIEVEGKKVVMFHFPIFEWNRMHHGSYHLYGHVHGHQEIPGRAIDVGIDNRPQKDMGLWSWEELDKILSKIEIRAHHQKFDS